MALASLSSAKPLNISLLFLYLHLSSSSLLLLFLPFPLLLHLPLPHLLPLIPPTFLLSPPPLLLTLSLLLPGKAQPGRDVVLFLSHSGNTPECVAAALQLVARGVAMLTLTGNKGELMEDCHVDSISDVCNSITRMY